jgi:hypothetical protein
MKKSFLSLIAILVAMVAIGSSASASVPGATLVGTHGTVAKGDEMNLMVTQDSMNVYADITHRYTGDDNFAYNAYLQRWTETSPGTWSYVTIASQLGSTWPGRSFMITFSNIAVKNAKMKVLVQYYIGGTQWGANYVYFTR